MTNEFVKTLKKIGRKWFIFLIVAIIIVAIFNMIAALIMTVITAALIGLSYVPPVLFNKNLKKSLNDFKSVDDKTIARKLKQPLSKIQKKMYEFSEKQSNKKWLIIFLNKQYIYYNEKTINKFSLLYNKGLGEKEVLEKVQNFGIKTRAEIKIIEELLVKYNRLDKREISVKEYRDKQRFNS